MNKIFYILLFLGITFSNSCFAYNVYSYENIPITGQYILSPAKQEIELQKEREEITNIYFANQTGVNTYCVVDIKDFKADDKVSLIERGGMYSLKDYIFLPVKEFKIKHGDKIEIPLRINIPSYSNPGTLYSAISFLCNKENNVSKNEISTLLFVNIDGDIINDGGIESFEINKKEFKLVYENKGNVYQKVNGIIEIKDFFGNTKEIYEIKDFFVLPESKRSLIDYLNLSPGYYLAEVRIGNEIIKKGFYVDLYIYIFLISVILLVLILKNKKLL